MINIFLLVLYCFKFLVHSKNWFKSSSVLSRWASLSSLYFPLTLHWKRPCKNAAGGSKNSFPKPLRLSPLHFQMHIEYFLRLPCSFKADAFSHTLLWHLPQYIGTYSVRFWPVFPLCILSSPASKLCVMGKFWFSCGCVCGQLPI